jgi:Tol biopolymer transport system component
MIDAPPGTRFSDSSRAPGAISPDGQYVVFSATDLKSGATRLWLHSLRTMATTSLPQTESSAQVFWSADSKGIAFFSAEGLKRVTIGGVRSDAVAAASEPRGGSWNRDGVVLFAQGPRTGLFRVSATGEAATPTPVIEPDRARGELGYLWPQFLPDGRRFIYFVLSNDDNVRGIYLASLDGGSGKRLVPSDASAVIAGDHLLFVRDGNLAVQGFDRAQGRMQGEAATLVARVGTSFDYRSAVSASDEGIVAYRLAEFTRLARYDRRGRLLGPLNVPPGRYRSPAISKSKRYLAVQQYRDTRSQLTILDLLRSGTNGIVSRGTGPREALATEFPTWGPGDRLAYASSDFGWMDIFARGISPGDSPALLLRSETDKIPTDWSPDGRFIAFMALAKAGSYDLWMLPTDRGRAAYPLLEGPADEGSGRFSPDGKRLAYVSNESGALEVWVRSFPDASGALKVSLSGGIDPEWISSDELSFLDLSGRLMTVSLPAASGRARAPVEAFATGVVNPGASRNHLAWTSGGTEVLINEPAPENDRRIRILANWSVKSTER